MLTFDRSTLPRTKIRRDKGGPSPHPDRQGSVGSLNRQRNATDPPLRPRRAYFSPWHVVVAVAFYVVSPTFVSIAADVHDHFVAPWLALPLETICDVLRHLSTDEDVDSILSVCRDGVPLQTR